MHNHSRARLRETVCALAVTAAIATGALGGCGVKGPLKLPPPAPGSATPPSAAGSAPAQPPEALPAEPPATPAQPAEPRKP